VVEVDPGDGEPAAGRVGRAEDAVVGADVEAHPVGGEVVGVGEDGRPLPRLQRRVRRLQARVGGGPRLRRRVGSERGGEEEQEERDRPLEVVVVAPPAPRGGEGEGSGHRGCGWLAGGGGAGGVRF
jgi:hypothetical protein